MNKLAILLFLLVSAFSCSSNNRPEDRAFDQVVAKTQKEIKKKYNAYTSSVGAAALNGIREISLGFCIEQNLSIDEARRIIVASEEILLDNANSNLEIRPYLVVFPFTPEQIGLSFYIWDDTHKPKQIPGALTAVSCYRGKIEYVTREAPGPYTRGGQRIIMHEETLEEARRIVENEQTS